MLQNIEIRDGEYTNTIYTMVSMNKHTLCAYVRYKRFKTYI